MLGHLQQGLLTIDGEKEKWNVKNKVSELEQLAEAASC